jgi:hypothetical protein
VIAPAAANRRLVLVIAALAAVGAALLAARITLPFATAAIGSDTQSSVLYFQRIAAGVHLERFLGTTPKPLLTVVDGPLRLITGDWRPIAWLALGVYGAAVATTVVLVGRLAGVVGAAFAAVALVVSPQLFLDAALAYAVSWALLCLAIAGLAATAERPRWHIAGIALAVGALARQEVFLLIGLAVAVVGWQLLAGRRSGRTTIPATAPIAIALVAVPLTLLHDLALTGDPLYFLAVPGLGAEGRSVATLGDAVRRLGAELWAQPVFVVLAVIGSLAVIARRAWPVVVGLLVMGPGMAAFFVWISARGFVSLDRYLAPLDLAIVVAAAIGASTVASAVLGAVSGNPASSSAVRGLALVGAAMVPLVLGPGIGQIDPDIRQVIRTTRSGAADWETLRPRVAHAIEAEPSLRVPVPPDDARSRDVAAPALLISAGLLPRAAVDLDLRLDRTGRLEAYAPTPEALSGWEGSVLYVDAGLSDGRMETAWLFEADPSAPNVALAPVAETDDRARLLIVQPQP